MFPCTLPLVLVTKKETAMKGLLKWKPWKLVSCVWHSMRWIWESWLTLRPKRHVIKRHQIPYKPVKYSRLTQALQSPPYLFFCPHFFLCDLGTSMHWQRSVKCHSERVVPLARTSPDLHPRLPSTDSTHLPAWEPLHSAPGARAGFINRPTA